LAVQPYLQEDCTMIRHSRNHSTCDRLEHVWLSLKRHWTIWENWQIALIKYRTSISSVLMECDATSFGGPWCLHLLWPEEKETANFLRKFVQFPSGYAASHHTWQYWLITWYVTHGVCFGYAGFVDRCCTASDITANHIPAEHSCSAGEIEQ